MSGYPSRHNRFSGGRPYSGMKHTKPGSRMEWKPKPQIITDESLDNVSSGQEDNSSLTSESTSGKMSTGNHKPALDISKQQGNPLPVVTDVTSGLEKLKLMPEAPQMADSGSELLGSVSTTGLNLKDTSLTPLSDLSKTGRSSDMEDQTHSSFSSRFSMYSMPTKSPIAADSGMEDRSLETGNQSGQISQEKTGSSGKSDDSVPVPSKYCHDICMDQSDSVVKLKAPLHVKNREKRNEIKRSVEGQNIIELRPGMVLMKGYISSDNQIKIVKACRDLGKSDGGFYQPGYRDGATLHLKMMCLGKNWDPESGKYGDTRPVDNAKPPHIPDEFHDLVKGAIQDSHAHIQKKSPKTDPGKIIPFISPNICIVNFYTKGGKLGLHQDKDESAESISRGLPVVSFSIGETAEFLYADVRDVDKADKVNLESGDVLIFGGKSRRIFHGVASILPGTAPTSLLEATNLQPGRLNLTFREF